MGNLTVLQVKNARPGRHGDGRGLYLLVSPSGAKSWVLRVQVDGRRRDFGLGSADLVSLQEAREKALEGRKMAKAGLNPSVEWKKLRTPMPTFEEAAQRYHDNVKGGWRNSKHGAQWLATLKTYAFPMLGRLGVDQIDAPEIQSVLLPIWQTIPETARRVRQRIAVVLDYARGQGWRATEAPMRAVNSLMKGIKQPRRGNFAAMPYSEVPALFSKLREMDQSVGRLALQFLILTAARSGEVRGATWDEVDWNCAQWNVPADRMKMGEAHSVPLSAGALEVLREAKILSAGRNDGLIFRGLRGKRMSDMTLGKALAAAGAGRFTVHGFRSSFRDWVAECTSYPGEWAEAALAHTVSNRVEAAYRRTRFLDQRRTLMKDWSKFVVGTTRGRQA